jgi:hypothetical protein
MIQTAPLAYPVSLAFLVAVLMAIRDNTDLRTAVSLFVNWVAGVLVLSIVPHGQAWPAFIVIDALTAAVILMPPAHMQQAIVGGLLLSQIVLHIAFGLGGGPLSVSYYYTTVNLAGWLQVASLIGGAAYDGGRKILLDWRGAGGGFSSDPHGDRGVAKRDGP